MNVLLVDDEFNDLELMKTVLEGAGHSVSTATNGASALDALKGKTFDLILIDIRMPVLSGYDLLKLLRERVNHNSKMIYVSIVPKSEVFSDDIDGFIQKPFKKNTLLAKVDSVCGK